MKRWIVTVLIATFALALAAVRAEAAAAASSSGSAGFGVGFSGQPDQEDQGHGPKDHRAYMTGTVVQTPRGVVLDSVDGWYYVEGANLSSMVGKKVTVTGEVREYAGARTIFITKFAEVQ
jgi:hypothetical protein